MQAQPVFVADGAAAIEALSAQDFDIALIDIEMPRVSGLQVMKAVRARPDAIARMPLVALTAYVLRDNREAIYAAGADGIIGKPIASADAFGRAILRHAGRPAGLPEPDDVLSTGGVDPGLGQKMDEDRLEALLDIAGPEGGQELLARLDEDLCSVRTRLVDGVAARDVAAIREQTHILIALAGAVGADRLSGLAEVLNVAAKRGRLGDLSALHAPLLADLDDLMALVSVRAAELG
jgi:CheY-like chemotaxis protein